MPFPASCALLILVAAATVSPVHAAPPGPRDVRALPSSAGAIRFVVDVPEPLLEPGREGTRTMRLAIDGYDGVAPQGHPLLPERVVTVAVPPNGEVSVSAAASAAEVIDDVRLALAPLRLQKLDPAPGAEAPIETPAEEALEAGGSTRGGAAPLAAGVRARLLEVGWMRNQRIARIAITPADYDPAFRRLTIAHRIEVEVAVSGARAPSSEARPSEQRDAFERIYRATLVNYAQGLAWRREARSAGGAAGSMWNAAPMRAAGVAPTSSIYAGRLWVKLAIASTGFYKVRFADLRNLGLFGGRTTTPLDSLRLYTWPGLPVLPEDNYCDACDYREVAMGFVEDVAGKPDTLDRNEEYLYFYALGTSDWASFYDPAQPDTVFLNHPYEKTNYYYLTIGTPALEGSASPKRIGEVSGDPTGAIGAVTPATFEERLHYELDTQYWPNPWPNPRYDSGLFWEKWYWQNIEAGRGTFLASGDAPGVSLTMPSRLRMRSWGVTDVGFRKSAGYTDHYLDVTFNGLGFERRSWNGLWAQTYDTTQVGLVRPSNTLGLSVPDTTDPNPTFDARRVDVTALAWFDLFYDRRFEPVNDALAFSSPPGFGGSYLYRIGPFSAAITAPPRVFDVTDPLAPIEVLGGTLASGTLSVLRNESGPRRYRVLPSDQIEQLPASSVFMAPSSSLNNLRAAPDTVGSRADYLIIYYDGFEAAAKLLADARKTRLPLDGTSGPYETAIVPISAVYDQFSGGRTDPGAIRNFLRAVFFNWADPEPAFVTLFGDASYDFKNIGGYAPEGLPGTLLPAYEGGYVEFLQSQYATDDWMLNVDDAVTVIPDFIGGRIPAGDAASAMAFVRDKLLPYERTAPLGEWRNRVMLIADDHVQVGNLNDRDPLLWLHMQQTAALDTAVTPDHVDRAYVYLHTYPTGTNVTKPGAKADVLKHLNEGVVMWNYIGHGSPFKISDEGVFIDADAGSLTNATRPGLFVAASCDVGKYHDPSVQSLGERLVMNPGGGCIAVVSATELAFSGENAELNKTLYRFIFDRDPDPPGTGQYHQAISEALLAAKTGSANNQKYQVMGDAATRLNLPRHWVEITLKDSDGNVVHTLQRGGIYRFDGQVLDRPGGTLVPFTGSAAILIEDSAPIDTTFECDPACGRVRYPFRAAPAFRGDARVLAGTFTGQFVVPLDAVLGSRGRIRGYASGDATGIATSTDGAGSDSLTLISGTAPPGDDVGPRIGLSFAGGSTAVRPDAQLRIDLTDDHGILITGHTIQNGIIVTVDNNSNTRVDVTSSFRYTANSYQAGTASFTLPGLAPGPHSIRVSAADNLASGINAAQHRSSASIDFEVSALPPLTVQRAFLFPNPTRSGGPGGGGLFVIDAPGDPVNVLLHLYTVSGRLIRTLKAFGGQGQIQIPWDGLDAEGDRLANGTYLFMVQVNGREADGSSSARSRAVGQGRVVVVGR
jgi:peptidase C25-like protein